MLTFRGVLSQQEMLSKTDAVCPSICHDNGRLNGNVCVQIHRPLRPKNTVSLSYRMPPFNKPYVHAQ